MTGKKAWLIQSTQSIFTKDQLFWATIAAWHRCFPDPSVMTYR